ncbi:MAG: hypothetical protein WC248_05665, partial [Candidatus Methanomethylophilaceae archaeon]
YRWHEFTEPIQARGDRSDECGPIRDDQTTGHGLWYPGFDRSRYWCDSGSSGSGYFCKDRVLVPDDYDRCRADARDGDAALLCCADFVRGGADDIDGLKGLIT